jgi:Domain of unknown function (4846)
MRAIEAMRWTERAAITALAGLVALVASLGASAPGPLPYPWLADSLPGESGEPLDLRMPSPEGYERVPAAPGSFGSWLRALPLRPGCPPVRLFDGQVKAVQDGHRAVVLLDVGSRDLQQCADAVIRLRAEYLFAAGCDADIAFGLTNGQTADWGRWRRGERPRLLNDRLVWSAQAPADDSRASFRHYLECVFAYAGSASLERDLVPVSDPALIEIGDVFVHGGFPGHAAIVVDVAADTAGRRVFLLAQSYMPAQEVYIVGHPGSRIDPWYEADAREELATPEWTFHPGELRRFHVAACESLHHAGVSHAEP